jgi:metal-dependent amidase/aminoacylase/carboxypeptidase family protein
MEIVERESAYSELRSDPDLAAIYKRNAEELGRILPDLGPGAERFAGSTDMGNISLAMPAIHPMIGVNSLPAVNHQPEFAAHGVTPDGDKAITDGAIAMAWTIIDAAMDEKVRQRLLAGNTVYRKA